MKRLGLTGSVGMGKSTTAALFREEGAPIFDADAAVHALYAEGGAAVPLIEAAFPGTTTGGAVDRAKLSAELLRDPAGLPRLEALVHPLLVSLRLEAVGSSERSGAPVMVFDVPLLFETGGERAMDAVAVVTCSPDLQRARVLARPGMTVDKFEALLRRQTPDAEKRSRADFVIDTSNGLGPVRRRIREILKALKEA